MNFKPIQWEFCYFHQVWFPFLRIRNQTDGRILLGWTLLSFDSVFKLSLLVFHRHLNLFYLKDCKFDQLIKTSLLLLKNQINIKIDLGTFLNSTLDIFLNFHHLISKALKFKHKQPWGSNTSTSNTSQVCQMNPPPLSVTLPQA